MSDLIDRQTAITAICEDGTWLESQGCTEITMCERKQRDADILSELPTIDAIEAKHGRWILGGEEGWPKWTCSVCGGDGRGDYKVCPWCGAKMEVDDAD